MEWKSEAYIIENGWKIRPVLIMGTDGYMVRVMFRDSGGAICVRPKRIYLDEEKARAVVDLYRERAREEQARQEAGSEGHESPSYRSPEMKRRYELDFSGFP